jgi:hypothetical protein
MTVSVELRPLTGPLSNPPIIWVNMKQRWNDMDRGKPKNSEKNLSECHFVHYKSNMVCPEREPGPRGENPATIRLSYGTANNELRGCVISADVYQQLGENPVSLS